MRWASQATQEVWSSESSEVMPIPWPKLASLMRPRGGNCGVVIAAPGVGKTTFLLNWIVKSQGRALYMSADTTPQDLTAQLGALATGEERTAVETKLQSSSTWRQEYGQHISQTFPNLVLDFDPQPSLAGIAARTDALTELWGVPPQFIVMDTASNVRMKDRADNAEWQNVWLTANEIARTFSSFFVFAHHVKQGPSRSGRTAPEMSDGLWGSDTYAEFVLGLHTPRPGMIDATIRKNRTGRKDVRCRFVADLARADIEEESSG